MVANKVVFGTTVLVDLTADTVTAAKLLSGETAHGADGEPVTGALQVVTYHLSASEPTASQGSDGDIWLVTA